MPSSTTSSVLSEPVPAALELVGTGRNCWAETPVNTTVDQFRDVGTGRSVAISSSTGSRSLERNRELVVEPVKRPRRKCALDCACKRHRGHTPETRAKISATLKRRTETDAGWREHLARIGRERWERERAA